MTNLTTLSVSLIAAEQSSLSQVAAQLKAQVR